MLGCFVGFMAACVMTVGGWIVGGFAFDHLHSSTWSSVAVGREARVTLQEGTYGVYESASYDANLQVLNGPTGDNVSLTPSTADVLQTRSGRTFRLSSLVTVGAGDYRLVSTPSSFSHPAALVALGPDPASEAARRVSWALVGAAVGCLLGGVGVPLLLRRR